MNTSSGPLSQQLNPNRLEPTRKPQLDLLDFVVFVVTKVFNRSTDDALALTLALHTQGKGIAGTYTFEVAEQKQCEVLLMAKVEEHPLRVEVERV